MTIDKVMNSKQNGIFSSSGRRITLIIILGAVGLIVILFCLYYFSAFGFPRQNINFFPVENKPSLAYPLARCNGRLVLVNNSIHIVGIFGSGYLIIWPYGYSVEKDRFIPVIRNDHGKIIARVGDWVTIGGGNTTRENAETIIGQSISTNQGDSVFILAPK